MLMIVNDHPMFGDGESFGRYLSPATGHLYLCCVASHPTGFDGEPMLEAFLAVMAEAPCSDRHYLRRVSCSISNT